MKKSLLLALCLSSVAVAAPAAEPEAVLKLEPYRKSVAIRMESSGKSGLFAFDTAGGTTVISPEYAKAIGCKPWGQLVGYQMTGNRLATPRCDGFTLSAGGYKLNTPVLSVLDISSHIAKDAAPIEGSLALDAFAGRTITMDFAAGALIVETPQSAAERVRGARELPIRLSREVGGLALAPLLEIPTEKGTVRFEIDSGNGGTILVSKPYASLFGLDPEAPGPQQATIKLAEGLTATGLMFTPDLTIDGNIGMPFLKDWALTMDLAQGRMWIQRSKSTPPPGMGVPPPLPAK